MSGHTPWREIKQKGKAAQRQEMRRAWAITLLGAVLVSWVVAKEILDDLKG